MKKTIILAALILTAAVFSTVEAQLTPPGAGDKDLRDTNVKGRSNELERIDREMKKSDNRDKNKVPQTRAAEQAVEDKLAVKYVEIKLDYEQIQLSQDSIIKAYQSVDKIDFIQIGKFSSEIGKSAMRLNSNLFPPVIENTDAKKVESSNQKKVEKSEQELKKSKNIRDIIVELDNAIGSFATSPMFQNLRTVDPVISEKTRLNLEKIYELSGMLGAEAEKMAKTK